MTENSSRTIEKALAINLDPTTYGTIVEIGAGQEVARWFFQAGAAAGTIAKTMSAYDMKFSDEIYGEAPDQRYVSRARLQRMLEREYELVISRIEEQRPDNSRFFAFANTVAAQGFKKRAECHGWLGVRLQSAPKAPPDDIIIHVRLLDETNLEQQEALGILGVNLIYGAFHHAETPEKLLVSLMDNLRWGRVEIDLVELNGPNLGAIDNRLMALELVKAGLTRAVLFDPNGNVVIPSDSLYKRRVLAMRGKFHIVEQSDIDLLSHARRRFQ
ncbi:MAG: TonB-dependent receptor, partial [Rhodospirillaceae bacterium]|nr:TonB-dependent receptor [Rhodospirillaceae bacterium]